MAERPSILLVLLPLGLAVAWLSSHFQQTPAVSAPKRSAPGWGTLIACSEATSFDSKRSLSLLSDGRARLTDRSAEKIQVVRGEWSVVDDDRHLYRIDVEGSVGNYFVVSPPDAEGCLLSFGSVDHADLRRSWFSIQIDENDLRDPP